MLVPQHAEAEAKNPSVTLGKFKDSREEILFFESVRLLLYPIQAVEKRRGDSVNP
jgi:hypothetical protein